LDDSGSVAWLEKRVTSKARVEIKASGWQGTYVNRTCPASIREPSDVIKDESRWLVLNYQLDRVIDASAIPVIKVNGRKDVISIKVRGIRIDGDKRGG
jgi:hypothetical protein